MNYDIQTTYKGLPVSELRKEEQEQVVGTASLCPGSDNPAAAAAQDNSPPPSTVQDRNGMGD